MVVHKRQSLVDVSESVRITKKYYEVVCKNSLLIYPFNYEIIEPTYFGPIIYIIILGVVNSCIYIFSKIIMKGFSYFNGYYQIIPIFLLGLFFWTVFCCSFIFLITYFESSFLEKDYDVRQFGLVTSSLTYLTIVLIFSILSIDILTYVVSFARVLLISYYLSDSYFKSIAYPNERKMRIHSIIIFLYVIAMGYIFLPVFSYSEELVREFYE